MTKRVYKTEYFDTISESWAEYSYKDDIKSSLKCYVLGLESGHRMRILEMSGKISRQISWMWALDRLTDER